VSDVIKTERLVLRRARPADAKALFQVFSDPEVMRYWSSLPHPDVAETRRWLQSMIDAEGPGSDDYIVTLGGKVIGKLGCWKLPEVGYALARNVWGRGLAHEALSAFVAHRRTLGPGELTADVDPRNLASRNLLERCSFAENGQAARTWLVGDEWCDSIYYRLRW
jgi:[ribosomal protein S5]-alanine N-acetyltransferase